MGGSILKPNDTYLTPDSAEQLRTGSYAGPRSGRADLSYETAPEKQGEKP